MRYTRAGRFIILRTVPVPVSELSSHGVDAALLPKLARSRKLDRRSVDHQSFLAEQLAGGLAALAGALLA
jgi:hypothetical protein